MSEHLSVRREDGVLQLRFQRPEKKNAITRDMYLAMAEALEQAADDAQVRAVLLAGSAECFSAGNDLNDFLQHPPTVEDRPAIRFLRALAALPQPAVAAVGGVAVGIGTTLLLHCDVVFAAPDARFQLPFVNLGLVPEAASTLLLPQLVGYHRAAQWLLLGEPFGAGEAESAGLVNAVIPADTLLEHATATAQRFTQLPPRALAASKRLLKKHQSEQVRAVMDEELDLFVHHLGGAEAREAISAVLEKRTPDFSRNGGGAA